MTLHDVGAVGDLPAGRPLVVSIGYVDLLIWRVGSAIHATDRWCPHARGDLSSGAVAGTQLTCGDHGWSFDLTTGACLKQPGRYTLPIYRCHVRGGRIEVELPPAAAM